LVAKVPWVRVFAEGLVIVASILLALAADAWWQTRQDREIERDALRLILVDLAVDTLETRRVLSIAGRHAAAAAQLQSLWDDPESPVARLDSASRRSCRGITSSYRDQPTRVCATGTA